MRPLFIILTFIFSFNLNANSSERSLFSECRFSVVLGKDWNVLAIPTLKNKCKLEVQNLKLDANLSVSLGYDQFLTVVSQNGFDYFNNSWVTRGRQGISEKASIIDFEYWQGVKGIITSGCHSKAGYSGICLHQTIVLREDETFDGTVLLIKGTAKKSIDLEEVYKTLLPVY